jgi:HK97 family phage major capsid protein
MDRDTHTLLAELKRAFGEFRNDNDARLTTIEQHVREMETAAARLEFSGAPTRPALRTSTYGGVRRVLQRPDISAKTRKELRGWMRSGNLDVQAGASVSVDPDGGFLVSPELDRMIESLLVEQSPMRQIARVVPVRSSEWKKLVDEHGVGSGWVGETQSRPETESPDLGEISIPSCEVYANPKTTQKLLDDGDHDVAAWLTENIADEFSLQEGGAFVTGNGVTRPRGFTTYPTSTAKDADRALGTLQYVASGAAGGFQAASATVSPADVLIDLVHTLRAGYRTGAVWTMNSLTLAAIRKFKDVDGNLIVRPGLEQGAPSLLLGYPVVEMEDMADIAADAFPIAFGNFQRGYVITDRNTRILRDPYTAKPHVLFYSTKRVGGGVVNSECIKLLKIAAA